MLRAACDCRRPQALGSRRAIVCAAFPWQLGHRRFWRLGNADSLDGLVRRRFHRLESPARAGAGRSVASKSLQRLEPAFSQCVVHRGPGGAGVRAMPRGACAHGRAAVRAPIARPARAAVGRLSRRRGFEIRNSCAAVSRFFGPSTWRCRASAAANFSSSSRGADCRCNCMPGSMRWTGIFAQSTVLHPDG